MQCERFSSGCSTAAPTSSELSLCTGSKMAEKEKLAVLDTKENFSPLVVFAIVANICVTLSCVFFNKYLVTAFGFDYMFTLTFAHFLFTSGATRLMLWLGFFKYKKAAFRDVLPVAIANMGSVALMNENLAYNSVGFYQISKIACIPATIVLQYFMYGAKVSARVQVALVVILAGVYFATVSDVQLNLIGSIFAVFAVAFTVLGQIFTGSKQKLLNLDAMQLLYHVSPIMSVGMFCLIPFFDNILDEKVGLLYYGLTLSVPFYVLITCVLALGVNISNYLVIGQTSPVTYQVAGHMKTVTIFIINFVVFGVPIIPRNLFGIILAVLGSVTYGELKRKESSTAGAKRQAVKAEQAQMAAKAGGTPASDADLEKGLSSVIVSSSDARVA